MICVEAIAYRKHASSAGETAYARRFVRFTTTDVGRANVAARRPAIVTVKLFYFGGYRGRAEAGRGGREGVGVVTVLGVVLFSVVVGLQEWHKCGSVGIVASRGWEAGMDKDKAADMPRVWL